MQVRPLLITLIPPNCLRTIMHGKTEGSVSPKAHAVFRAWRQTSMQGATALLWSLSVAAACPAQLPWMPGSALIPTLRMGRGSKQHHWLQFLLGRCCAKPKCLPWLYGEFSMGKCWLCASCVWTTLLAAGASARHRRRQQASARLAGDDVGWCDLLGESRSSFHYRKHRRTGTVNWKCWQTTNWLCI